MVDAVKPAPTLYVWLLGDCVGQLSRWQGKLIFQYGEDWLARSDAVALSHSLPLRAAPFTDGAVKSFFAGLLPEGQLRQLVSQQTQVSVQNEFALLEKIGGECAGAVSLLPRGILPPTAQDASLDAGAHWLSDDQFVKILDELPRRPMLAGKDGLRLSLAGAQDKLPVIAQWSKSQGLRIALPLGGAPSTHILKPPIAGLEGTVANEAFCLALARELGLNAAQAQVCKVQSREFLLVERYDRTGELKRRVNAKVKRLHQEDFCQAMGVMPEFKYQNEGGPDLAQCFAFLREITRPSAPHVLRLLDAVIFNALVGNHDAHAKNFSVLYNPRPSFAPLYDILSTAVYEGLSGKMAMKIGNQYRFSYLQDHNWEQLAQSAGLSPAQTRKRVKQVAEVLPQVCDKLLPAYQEHPIIRKVHALILKRCERLS
jgi:serine/threonine-protein kinase HipA